MSQAIASKAILTFIYDLIYREMTRSMNGRQLMSSMHADCPIDWELVSAEPGRGPDSLQIEGN